MQQFDFFLAETQINRFLAPCLMQFYGDLKEIRSTLNNINAKQKFPSKLRGLGGSLSMIKFEENFQINA